MEELYQKIIKGLDRLRSIYQNDVNNSDYILRDVEDMINAFHKGESFFIDEDEEII